MKYILTVDTNKGNEAVCCEEDKEKAHIFSLDMAKELKRKLNEEFPWRAYRIYSLQEVID